MGRPGASFSSEGEQAGGFTLVELLIAATVAAIVLGAAYAWLWNVAALADAADDRAQAATSAAAVSRAVARDAHASLRIVEPPPGRDPSCSLALVRIHAGAADETTLVVWDPERGVVWRNASGTYLSDHVTLFAVAYVLADGSLIEGGRMAASDWASIRAVRITLTSQVGAASARRSVVATVGLS
jgi:prepilin-type N-terminal cleavage/methylation domain-containing protein